MVTRLNYDLPLKFAGALTEHSYADFSIVGLSAALSVVDGSQTRPFVLGDACQRFILHVKIHPTLCARVFYFYRVLDCIRFYEGISQLPFCPGAY